MSKKIPRVFIGCQDTFSQVNGEGIKKLNDAGIAVQSGILENECRELNRRFFSFHEKKRPYIILKWAQSLDQFIAPKEVTEENRWISNAHSRRLSHKWRTEEQAIMVGSNTVNSDNPGLTARDWTGKNPLRIVIDPLDSIPTSAKVLDNAAATIIFSQTKKDKKENIEWFPVDFSKNANQTILDELYRRNIQSVIVEGGAFTLRNFIEQNLWDEARIFIANKFLGGGVKAPVFEFSGMQSDEKILDDKLYIFRNN